MKINLSKEINLLVYDELEHYENNLKSLGVSAFKSINRVQSLSDVKNFLKEFKDFDLIFLIVHVFYTESIKGIKEYKVSGIKEEYEKIGELYVSDGVYDGIKDEMHSKKIYEDEKIRQYYQVKRDLGNGSIQVYTKAEIVRDILNQDRIKERRGIFLSHSSEDKIIVQKFMDLVLILGLNIKRVDIKFTSIESGGIPSGDIIPDNVKNFLKD